MGEFKTNLRDERIGMIVYDKYGVPMKIVEYKTNMDIKVEFQDEYKAVVSTRFECFINKRVKNPYRKTFFNEGYIGQGEYRLAVTDYEKNRTSFWSNMIKRVYGDTNIHNSEAYIGAYIDDFFKNYQNFAKWFDENYYEIDDEVMCLDKDILIKGNKVYSPNTCVFVPQRINNLFTKRQNCRGNYPIGVHKYRDGIRYVSLCNTLDRNGKSKRVHLGLFNTPLEAFEAYKKFKENYIKQVADEYKDKIPKKLYEAMYNWVVDIND